MTEELSKMLITVSRYRIYLMKYLNINKTELLKELSKRINISEQSLHLSQIQDIEHCSVILKALKDWKLELTGVKNLKKGNPRDLAKKDLGKYNMKVVEIFNSIDGEGKRAGELTTFIRLFGCNLRCSFCDTPYSYNQETDELPYKEMSITEIIEECDKYNTDNITVTGGEPLIHLDIKYLLRALSEAGYNVNVETNGAVKIAQYFNSDGTPAEGYENVWFTVDYKSPSSGMEEKMIMDNFDVSKYKYHNVVYKFVVGNEEDLNKAYTIITDKIIDKKQNDNGNIIYLSPIFGDIEPREIVEYMQKTDLFNSKTPIRVQLQLHKIIWDPMKKGV